MTDIELKGFNEVIRDTAKKHLGVDVRRCLAGQHSQRSTMWSYVINSKSELPANIVVVTPQRVSHSSLSSRPDPTILTSQHDSIISGEPDVFTTLAISSPDTSSRAPYCPVPSMDVFKEVLELRIKASDT